MPSSEKRDYPSFEITYWGEDDTPSKIITVESLQFAVKREGLKMSSSYKNF